MGLLSVPPGCWVTPPAPPHTGTVVRKGAERLAGSQGVILSPWDLTPGVEAHTVCHPHPHPQPPQSLVPAPSVPPSPTPSPASPPSQSAPSQCPKV